MSIPEVDKLDKSSGDVQMKAAISSCIATEIQNGRDPEQAKAMCFSMVKSKMGGNPASPEAPQGGI